MHARQFFLSLAAQCFRPAWPFAAFVARAPATSCHGASNGPRMPCWYFKAPELTDAKEVLFYSPGFTVKEFKVLKGRCGSSDRSGRSRLPAWRACRAIADRHRHQRAANLVRRGFCRLCSRRSPVTNSPLRRRFL